MMAHVNNVSALFNAQRRGAYSSAVTTIANKYVMTAMTNNVARRSDVTMLP